MSPPDDDIPWAAFFALLVFGLVVAPLLRLTLPRAER